MRGTSFGSRMVFNASFDVVQVVMYDNGRTRIDSSCEVCQVLGFMQVQSHGVIVGKSDITAGMGFTISSKHVMSVESLVAILTCLSIECISCMPN